MLDTISGVASLSEEDNGYAHFLPLVRLNFTDDITSAAYLKVQIEGYEVSLFGLTPSWQMLTTYKNLPENYYDNFLPYYHFVSNYGTGVSTSTTFGGRFQVLVTSDRLKSEVLNTDITDKASIEGVLNNVINTDAQSSRVTMLVEGGGFPASTSRKDIAQWQQLVVDAPISLFPRILPIHKFLEPHSSSKRNKGLERVVQFEKQNQNIKKVLYALDLIKRNKLSIFLRNILDVEVTKVCPSEQIYNIVRNVLSNNNLDLAKYGLRCVHDREYSYYYKEEIIETHVFKLLPGLCFTMTEKLAKCVSSKITQPNNVQCVKLFKRADCEGAVDKIVKNPSELTGALNEGLKSFMFCEN